MKEKDGDENSRLRAPVFAAIAERLFEQWVARATRPLRFPTRRETAQPRTLSGPCYPHQQRRSKSGQIGPNRTKILMHAGFWWRQGDAPSGMDNPDLIVQGVRNHQS